MAPSKLESDAYVKTKFRDPFGSPFDHAGQMLVPSRMARGQKNVHLPQFLGNFSQNYRGGKMLTQMNGPDGSQ